MPLTPAEKQQAYRLRREQEIREHFGYALSETRTAAERDTAAKRMLASLEMQPSEPLTEERYVAECMKLSPIVPVVEPAERKAAFMAARARQEAYARWRWQAFHAGEVASL